MVVSLTEALNQERLHNAGVMRERDDYLHKFAEVSKLLQEHMAPEEFAKVQANLEASELSADVSARHADLMR